MATRKLVLCDTSILIDLFDPARAHHGDAVALLWYAAEQPSVVIAAPISAFKDAYYVLSRLYRDESKARDSIASVLGAVIEPLDLLARYGTLALGSDEPDFEDALIRTCAEQEGATALITRDGSAFKGSSVPAMTASEFLESEGFDYWEMQW